MLSEHIIYLDNNSTTQTDSRVIETMVPIMSEVYANPASSHNFGVAANKIIKEARSSIADLINAQSEEIIFTSGATEAINTAIKGVCLANLNKKNKIIAIATEHKAVLDTYKFLEKHGFEVIYLPVGTDGLVDQDLLENAVDENTLLVSAMLVNNETGIIQDVKALSVLSKRKGAYFFCDATQAVGKITVDVADLEVDLLCFSGHKFHGPKGIGVLYISSDSELKKKIQIANHGGGQEFGIRSGTLNTSGIIGLAKACIIAKNEMQNNAVRIKLLRDKLETELLKIESAFLNGHKTKRIYNTCNICFPNQDANVIIGRLKNIALSNGSACTSLIVEPSHVLRAMGLSNDLAFSALRFSLSRYNTEDDIDNAIKALKEILVSNQISISNN